MRRYYLFLSFVFWWLTGCQKPEEKANNPPSITDSNHLEVVWPSHLLPSQAGYPNAVAKVKMPNTNHQQMRNSTETKRAFDDLFDRNIPNTRFFYTDRR